MKTTSSCMTISWKDRTKQLSMLLLLGSILFNISCKKQDENTVGSDVIGDRSGFDIRVTDTFEVVAYSVKADSVPETNTLPYYLLGQMNDPVLGRTSADIITQFSVPFENFTFEGTIDSVVLQLRYAGANGVYGNKATAQSIRVYELDEDLPVHTENSSFHSAKSYRYKPALLGEHTGVFNVTDSVMTELDSVKIGYAPQLRVRITDPSFIARLQALSGITEASFKSQFKGLVVSAGHQSLAPGEGALAFMYLSQAESNVTVYTRKTDGSHNRYQFPVSRVNESKTNRYVHSGQPADLQPVNGGVHQPNNYIQAAGGIRLRVLIPGLNNLAANQAIAVNNARLVLTAKADALYEVPSRLIPYGADEKGALAAIPDFNEQYGGTFNAGTQTYSFNVNRYIQQMLTTYYQEKRDINYGFNITIPTGDINAARRLLLDTDNSDPASRKLKFILTYTVIK